MGSLRFGYDWVTSLSLFTFTHWRRKWQSTPVFLPGKSQGWGSLVGCRLRVTQSWTRLKWLSSSNWQSQLARVLSEDKENSGKVVEEGTCKYQQRPINCVEIRTVIIMYIFIFFFHFHFLPWGLSVSESNYGLGLCLEAMRSSGFDFEEISYPLINQLSWVILKQVIMWLP